LYLVIVIKDAMRFFCVSLYSCGYNGDKLNRVLFLDAVTAVNDRAITLQNMIKGSDEYKPERSKIQYTLNHYCHGRLTNDDEELTTMHDAELQKGLGSDVFQNC